VQLGEAGREHDRGADAPLGAGLERFEHPIASDHQNRQIGCLGQIERRWVTG
jgi:hypothetical protein